MKRRLKRFVGTIGFWAAWPLCWIVLHNTHRTRILCIYDGKVLLTLPTLGMNRWSLPGGGIRKGENPAEAACRELHEELGIELSAAALRPLAVEPASEDSGIQYHCHYYSVVLDERPLLRAALEIADARWQPKESIDEIVTKQIVKRALALWEVH